MSRIEEPTPTGIGHKYFSAEKSCDPDSARQLPSFDSFKMQRLLHFEITKYRKLNFVTLRGIEPRFKP